MAETAENAQEQEARGVALVRERLFDPLEAGGMQRRKRTSAAAHDAMKEKLARWLSYLTGEELDLLRQTLERYAGGPAKNEWPGEVAIKNLARVIRENDEDLERLVRSWMRSAAGRRAWDRGPGHAVAELRFLRAKKRPPYTLDRLDLEVEGDDLDRDARIRDERRARGLGGTREDEAAARWRAAVEEAKRLVFPHGERARDDAAA